MINKRLLGLVPGSMKYIKQNVLVKWLSLVFNILLVFAVSEYLQQLFAGQAGMKETLIAAGVILAAMIVRGAATKASVRLSFLASKEVKKTLRQQIYEKLLKLGSSYAEQIPTSEAVQISVEGVEQLETYFGAYLPQFFYCMLGPTTLFIVLAFVSLKVAIILLVCVPLIPISIVAVQKIAKKIMGRYWGQYTVMGNTFLENIQGLTTLKIYQADDYRHKVMNDEAEKFRKATMRLLMMQLNSITVMDLVAYGGAALGILLAAGEFAAGRLSFDGCVAIILLAADFFLPMRALGSFFHVAMSGMAASDKIFHLLDLPEPEEKHGAINPKDCGISCREVRFSYEKEREILHGVSMDFPQGSFVSIVGESGCGKSTIASLLMGRNRGYSGSIRIGGQEISGIGEKSRMENLTLVSHDSYIFRGSVGDNLRIAKPDADEKELWEILAKVNLADFLRSENGLETELQENGSNLSGGQRQRLALARALLHDTPVYLFDEATSNIDVESENEIMALIHELAKTRTVILISHRLANVTKSDRIYVLDAGSIAEEGTHEELIAKNGAYRKLWDNQQSLEQYGMSDANADSGKHAANTDKNRRNGKNEKKGGAKK